jgi:16S rRNA (adenine1518-N6/adenine1519-N6)-dimethyltransferase
MVQKEAASRLSAKPGTRDSSAITVAVSYYAEARTLFGVSAGSFLPAPKVDSAVIQLTLREPEIRPADETVLFWVIKAAFAQRRKTVLNSLSSSMGTDKAEVSDILAAAGIEPSARAERLTLDEFIRIADELASRS